MGVSVGAGAAVGAGAGATVGVGGGGSGVWAVGVQPAMTMAAASRIVRDNRGMVSHVQYTPPLAGGAAWRQRGEDRIFGVVFLR